MQRKTCFVVLGAVTAAIVAVGVARERSAAACSRAIITRYEILELEPVTGGAPTTLAFESRGSGRLVLANDPTRKFGDAQ